MLYPLNKYLVVEPVCEEEQDKSTVLIPDGVELKSTSPFCAVKLLEPNMNSNLRSGMTLVAPSHMVEKAEIHGRLYYLLLESQVVGFMGEDEN